MGQKQPEVLRKLSEALQYVVILDLNFLRSIPVLLRSVFSTCVTISSSLITHFSVARDSELINVNGLHKGGLVEKLSGSMCASKLAA